MANVIDNTIISIWVVGVDSYDIVIHNDDYDSPIRKVFEFCDFNDNYVSIWCLISEIDNLYIDDTNYKYRSHNSHNSYSIIYERSTLNVYTKAELALEKKSEIIIKGMKGLNRPSFQPEQKLYDYLINRLERELVNFD